MADSVGAVVLTYNRKDLVASCLEGLYRQTRLPDEIVVVDNGSRDGTAEFLAAHFPHVTVLPIAENAGFGPGMVAGIEHGYAQGHDWIWYFDDDDRPEPEALASLLEARDGLGDDRVGMIGTWGFSHDGHPVVEGEVWRNGRREKIKAGHQKPYRVDLLTFSGTLISKELLSIIGMPRSDYCIMFDDVEFCLRALANGFGVYVVPEPLTVMLRSGGAAAGAYPPWRGYYQTRNHIAMALQHRSAPEVVFWAVRQVKLCAATLLHLDRKWERIRLRLIGAWHGVRGVNGKTVSLR
jgi:rhamnopyranosyl-N-acetylglucosaminyl-diphospho-decaprenol beta-1,3/1,4-galactofuranosyltransferase